MHLMVGIILATVIASPGPVHVYSDIVGSYVNFPHADPSVQDNNNTWCLDEAAVALSCDMSEYTSAYVRASSSGARLTLSEAYLTVTGLPANGSFTAGEFYKPLGAPIPLANLSFTSLAFHSYQDLGLKLNFDRGLLNYEVGLVNGNPLAPPANCNRVGGSPILSNPFPGNRIMDHDMEVYGRVEANWGEDWGSLTVGLNGLYGKLSQREINALNPRPLLSSTIGCFTTANRASRRVRGSIDADYQVGPYRVFGEYLKAQDGRLRRDIISGAGSYTWYTRHGSVIGTLGYDYLNLNTEAALYSNPETWNRKRYSVSLAWWPEEFLEFLAEYNFNRENVRNPTGGNVSNDEFTIQSILYLY